MQALSYFGSASASLVAALAILYSFTLLGRSVRTALPDVAWSESVAALWDLYLGVTSAAILTTALGMLGLFNPFIFAAIVVTGPLLNLRHTNVFIAPWYALQACIISLREHMVFGLILLTSMVVVVVPTSVPEIFYDALYYHLGLSWQYQMAGAIQWRPGVVHSAFPAYLDVLFGLCLGLGGPSVAKFFNLLLFIVGWGATAALIYEALGDTRAALIGAVTISTVPGVVVMSTMCAIDSALIGFTAMSALAVVRIQKSQLHNVIHLALFAAFTAGFVAGSKYTGLWFIAVMALAILASHRPVIAARTAVFFLGTAILVASPWYLRNLLVIGDPIYPLLAGLMGDGDARWAIERLQRDVPAPGLSWMAFWNLVTGLAQNREGFGAGAQPGVLIPFGFMALIIGVIRLPIFRPLTIAAVIYFLLWLSQAYVLRYLYPIFPICVLGVAWVAVQALTYLRRPIIITAVVAILALIPLPQSVGILDALYVGNDVARLATGALSKDEYLSRRLAYYPAVQWLNNHAPPQAKVLYLGETRLLYLDRPVRFASAYDSFELADWLRPDSVPFFSQLQKQGITHILIHGHEIERLRGAYQYLQLSIDAEQRLRNALGECRVVFRKFGVQVCELP